MRGRLDRAWLLYRKDREEEALRETQRALGEDPEYGEAHTLMALCLTGLGRGEEATTVARRAIALEPESGLPHFVLARVLSDRDLDEEALEALRVAIRLQPDKPEYTAFEGSLLLALERFQEAVAAADRGLELEPDHVASLNVRAMALTRLGRHDEAARGVDAALEQDPDNSWSHANRGWTHLHKQETGGALTAFTEALRIDPNNEWARGGLVEALKARNFVYRWILSWYLFAGRFSGRARFGMIIGLYLFVRVSTRLMREYEALTPFAAVLALAYMGFVYLTWVGDGLFNLLLFLDPRGRRVMSREERLSGALIGASYALGLGFFAAAALSGLWAQGSIVLVAAFVLAIPASSAVTLPKGLPRIAGAAVAVGIALLIVAAGIRGFQAGEEAKEATMGFAGLAIFLSILSTWIHVPLMRLRSKS